MTLPEHDPSLGVNHELERLMLGDHKIKPKKFIVLNYENMMMLESIMSSISEAFTDKPKRIGVGKHVKRIVTARHGFSIKHPTMELWAYPVDETFRKMWKAYQDGKLPESVMSLIDSLTAEQKSALGNAVRNASEMDSSWRQGSIFKR